ncbi:phage integrase central domain-containing protein [Rosenbergiella australiborealis]|uniref:phage integrase central domain-containing protein n=1 Tax=Rosenbergiella australiborealis TaxID=1544696 RepID=UPI003B8A69F0
MLTVQNSFESITIEWHNHKKENWSQGYAEDILEYLTKDIFPFIGKRAKPVDRYSLIQLSVAEPKIIRSLTYPAH